MNTTLKIIGIIVIAGFVFLGANGYNINNIISSPDKEASEMDIKLRDKIFRMGWTLGAQSGATAIITGRTEVDGYFKRDSTIYFNTVNRK